MCCAVVCLCSSPWATVPARDPGQTQPKDLSSESTSSTVWSRAGPAQSLDLQKNFLPELGGWVARSGSPMVSAGLRNLFSMINRGRWVIIDEVIVWRQLGVDCVVWSQNKSRGWFKGNKSWGILDLLGWVVGQVGIPMWCAFTTCPRPSKRRQLCRSWSQWQPVKLHPEAPRSKCFLHSHGGLSASSAQTSEFVEAPGRRVMGCALIFLDRMLFRLKRLQSAQSTTPELQRNRKEGIHPRFIWHTVGRVVWTNVWTSFDDVRRIYCVLKTLVEIRSDRVMSAPKWTAAELALHPWMAKRGWHGWKQLALK